jgi:hypothetical protein
MLPKTGDSARRKLLPLFEIARLLVRFDHIAGFIINVNHGIMWAAEKLGVPDRVRGGFRPIIPKPTDWACKQSCITLPNNSTHEQRADSRWEALPITVFFVNWCGKSPNEILRNPPLDHSSWHFFQARSWLDYATRENAPSAIHYAALELRYGVEYLVFELLLLASESLSLQEIQTGNWKPKADEEDVSLSSPKLRKTRGI